MVGFCFPAMGIALVGVIVFSIQFLMDRLLVRDAFINGMRWASQVESSVGNLEAIFAGTVKEPPVSAALDTISAFGQVYRYEFVNGKGDTVFATGAYHPAVPNRPAQHHAHSHEISASAVADDDRTDRHGHGTETPAHHGHDPEQALAETEHEPSGQTHVVTHGASDAHHRHLISLEMGNGVDHPTHYALISHPIFLNDRYLGTIRVFVDQTDKHGLFSETLYWLLVILVGVSVLGFGIPCFYYFRGKAEAEAASARAQFLAQHDSMTSLLNRNRFVETVDGLLEPMDQREIRGALHFIDIDNFKSINDTLGHDVGDELLCQISRQLRIAVPAEHVISRIGGDEFAVFQVGVNSESESVEFARLLLSVFAGSFRIHGHDIMTTASIGTAVSGRDGSTCRALMKSADIALYVVKAKGRNGNVLFEPGMRAERDRRVRLESKIRRASEDDAFEIFFQPLFASRTSDLIGFEALIRLQDEDGAYIPPDQFIPVAEEMGLMVAIGERVLRESTRIAALWADHLVLSVNLSIRQFENGELVATVRRALAASGLPPQRLELEITEGLILQNTEWNLAQLRQLKDMGVAIVMDDFGMGYSSLSYLWRFPFDKLKIDRSFLRGLEGDSEKVTEIIKTIILLGHSLDMTVTAEGVETVHQLEMLRDFDCDLVQGYLLGRPEPADAIAPLVLDDFVQKTGLAAGAETRGGEEAAAAAR